MRAAFDHSWSLLGREEQDAFARLAVFRGEFSHAAARSVVGNPCLVHCRAQEAPDPGDERPVLSAGCLFKGFVEKALLSEVSPGRFRLHSLLRQYAEEKLALDRSAPEGSVPAIGGLLCQVGGARHGRVGQTPRGKSGACGYGRSSMIWKRRFPGRLPRSVWIRARRRIYRVRWSKPRNLAGPSANLPTSIARMDECMKLGLHAKARENFRCALSVHRTPGRTYSPSSSETR